MASQGSPEKSPPCCRNDSYLPISIIAKILLRLPFTSLPAASSTCYTFHEIIKSPQFRRVYDEQNKKKGWIVTDKSGESLCDPDLFFYDISRDEWHSVPISKICRPHETPLNPRMVSAYGGLILFTATKRDKIGHPLQERELVVVNPLSRQTRRLPDPPILLNSDTPSDHCIEMVEDESGSSYKVIILSFQAVNTVFIYDDSLQEWSTIETPEILPPEIEPASIISSRGVVYNGILCWLILVDLEASFIVFYDIKRDALFRDTLHLSGDETRGLCGIAVYGGHLVQYSMQPKGLLPKLKVSTFSGVSKKWELDHTVLLSGLGWDPVCLKMVTGHRMVGCSREEDEWVMWAVCLVTEAKFKYGRSMLQRHMELFVYDGRADKWKQLSPCNVGEPDDEPASLVQSKIGHWPLSQAKWMPLRFNAAV